MSRRTSHIQPPSPLDDYLVRFLHSLETLSDGFSPIADAERVAAASGVVIPFVEALFVSARTRGLIEPFRARGARGRYRWKVSARGARWLTTQQSETSVE